MGKTRGEELGLQDLADFFTELGKQLRQGFIEIQGRSLKVPPESQGIVKLKEKEDLFEIKISWPRSARPASGQISRGTAPRPQASFKEIKKQMNTAFHELQRLAGQGLFPDDRTLREFGDSVRAFSAFTQPAWQEAMQRFQDHVNNLQHAAAAQQREAMLQELRNLTNCMVLCHREFK